MTDDPINALPDGIYPFANERLPLSEMAMREAPRELEYLLKAAAVRNGTAIKRDIPVELTCEAAGFPDATFLVFWPTGEERIHILAPKTSVIGRA